MAKEYIKREDARLAVMRAGSIGNILPQIEALPAADVVSRGVLEQVMCERDLAINQLREDYGVSLGEKKSADVVEVVHGYHAGDVCIYGFGHENKSRAIVEIVKILNDERGLAEVKFHKVFVDDTGNGFFDYLLKIGCTMNASLKYLKNITPRMDGE